MKFKSKNEKYEYLRKKWQLRHRIIQDNLWEKHGQAFKQLAIGGLGGLMIFLPTSPIQLSHQGNLIVSKDDALKDYDRNVLLAEELREKLPKDVRPLDQEEESEITEILSRNFGFKVTAELDNVRLNRNYGLIGGEQHLYRYPGDNLYAHAGTALDWAKYGGAGIAPSLGAWGYFANSKGEFSEIDKAREKYYLAIQTFLTPGFEENVEKYRDFFKFRKMLVVNPNTGQAVIAVIADAGPASWTGKHLGGSPEVMDNLGLGDRERKGPVLYFFIDGLKDYTQLGPVKVQKKA